MTEESKIRLGIKELRALLGRDSQEIRIDLGCGNRKRPGHIGVDKHSLPGIDIVWDVENGLPFEDNCVDYIYSEFLFEHVRNLIFLFQEVYRVCRHNAIVEIIVPYYASIGAFKDPTHVQFFTEETIRYFTTDRWYGSDYGINTNFEVVKITYNYRRPFSGRLPFMWLFRRYLWNVVHSMRLELRVVKI
ncbi:MAG: methyltransferase domain-containing protein [Chloroflexi bacterium]|nr:methyltransferase domain-containing protein [Chloroflexota bacterium]MCL5076411.1 methyltransferase domain-containing protein [Chloroflexota bacterium]